MDDLFILAHLLSRFITWSAYEGEKKQNMQGNHKENTKEELICYICCEQTIQLEQRGMQRIWGIDPIACLTPKVGANLDRKLPLLGGLKIWLCSLCILYIDHRQYLPQGNMHQQSPQHPCEGNLQDAFCDFCNPKTKMLWVPPQGCPTELRRGRQKKDSHRLRSASASHPWTAPDESLNWSGLQFHYITLGNCTKIVLKCLDGKCHRQADSSSQQQVHAHWVSCHRASRAGLPLGWGDLWRKQHKAIPSLVSLH